MKGKEGHRGLLLLHISHDGCIADIRVCRLLGYKLGGKNHITTAWRISRSVHESNTESTEYFMGGIDQVTPSTRSTMELLYLYK